MIETTTKLVSKTKGVAKTAVSLTTEQYKNVISTIREGFIHDGIQFKPNPRLATILVTESNLGIRIGDVLSLTLNSIIKDGNRYRLDIVEEKTGKKRKFTVANDIYNYLKEYCDKNNIKDTAKIFDVKKRGVQRQLEIVTKYLKLEHISTHSMRKYYATELYNDNDHDIALVSDLLQHSSPTVTQRYISISPQKIEKAINNFNNNFNHLI